MSRRADEVMTARAAPVVALMASCVMLLATTHPAVAEGVRHRVALDAASLTAADVVEALDPATWLPGDEVSVHVVPGFAPGSSDWPEQAGRPLREVAEALGSARLADVVLIVEGHTDTSGPAGHNRRLSLLRAFEAVERLAALGVSRSRLLLRGVGEDDPLAGIAADSRLQRRIEFVRRFAGSPDDDMASPGDGDDECRNQSAMVTHGLSVLASLAIEQANPVVSPEGLRALLQILDWGASTEARARLRDYYLTDASMVTGREFRFSDCAWKTASDPERPLLESVSMDLILLRDGVTLSPEVAALTDGRGNPPVVHTIPGHGIDEWLGSVNREVEDATSGRVRNALALDGSEDLAVANVLSMHAPWLQPFDEALTREAEFRLADGSWVNVPMMQSQARILPYADEDGFVRVLLAYADSDHYMHLVLPDEDVGVQGLLRRLAGTNASKLGLRMTTSAWSDGSIIDWDGSAGQAIVDLPRFAVGGDIDIGAHMRETGHVGLLADPASFAGLTGDELPLLRLTQAIRMQTDETGSEVTAVSSGVFGRSAGVEDIWEFRFDRPFLYVIGQASSGSILVMGVVDNPLVTE